MSNYTATAAEWRQMFGMWRNIQNYSNREITKSMLVEVKKWFSYFRFPSHTYQLSTTSLKDSIGGILIGITEVIT